MNTNAKTSSSTRLTISLIASVVSMGLLTWVLWDFAIDPVKNEGNNNSHQLILFWGASAMGWVALTAVWRSLHLDKIPSTSSHLKISAIILLAALVPRLIIIQTHEPSLSDDVHRYVLDGANVINGINPYLPLPDQFTDQTINADWQWNGAQQIAARVNNPELHTIYLPVSQAVFAIGAAATDLESTSDTTRAMRIVFVVIEMMTIALLPILLKPMKRSPWWATLYAWHPLALTEIAGSGHQDVIGVFLLLGAMLLFARHWHRVVLSMIALAAAALVKPVVIPVGALLCRRTNMRTWLLSIGVGVAFISVVTAPLLLSHDGEPAANLKETTSRFSQKWSHFGPVYETLLGAQNLLEPIDDPEIQWQTKDRHEQWARLGCLGLVGVVIIALWRSRCDQWTATRSLMLALILCSSTAHPWYLIWALIFMPLKPSASLWICSLTIPLGYYAWMNAEEWAAPGWLMTLAYAPVAIALMMEVWKDVRQRPPIESPVSES